MIGRVISSGVTLDASGLSQRVSDVEACVSDVEARDFERPNLGTEPTTGATAV